MVPCDLGFVMVPCLCSVHLVSLEKGNGYGEDFSLLTHIIGHMTCSGNYSGHMGGLLVLLKKKGKGDELMGRSYIINY